MMNSGRTMTITTIVAVATIAAVVGYAVYFDHKRRNDTTFRKQLRRQQKKAHRSAAKATATSPPKEELLEALQKVKKEIIPTSAEEKELYFSQNIGIAEQLCGQGDAFYLPAALSFYRALRVYPNPMELILIFQRMVPEPILKLVMEMWSYDVSETSPAVSVTGRAASAAETSPKSTGRTGPPSETSSQEWETLTDPGMQARIEAYYDHFPNKDMNVSVKSTIINLGDDRATKKNMLVVTKDIEIGEVIYKEDPIIMALDPDLESTGSHCSQCLRKIASQISLRMPNDPLQTAYCSKPCQAKASLESYDILFGSELPIPDTPLLSGANKELRMLAQEKLVSHLREGKTLPLLVARLIAKQLAEEIANAYSNSASTHSTPATSVQEYNLYDHIERLRYLALPENLEETALLSQILKTSVPGLEEMLTGERYSTFKGKIAYNVIGICFGEGRDKKPLYKARPEDERTRAVYGTDRQIASGLYLVSSYLAHSCRPSVQPSFLDDTSTLHLVANHALKKGDELTMAYVDISQRQGETTQDAHLRRRRELVQGWRFACTCQKCLEEIAEGNINDSLTLVDESKVEVVVQRYESNMNESLLLENDIQD